MYVYIYISLCVCWLNPTFWNMWLTCLGQKTSERRSHENKDLGEYLHRCAFFMAPSPGTTSSTHTGYVLLHTHPPSVAW